MSAHNSEKPTPKDLYFWQVVWKFLTLEGFFIMPENLKEEGYKNNERYFIANIPGYGYQEMDKFVEGVDLMRNLQKHLFKKKYKANSFEWNYLGRTREREKYLDYLERTFWQNQTNESLKSLENFRDVIENPWKIVKQASNLDIELKTPFEFFEEKTTKFLGHLNETLVGADLNPFLICSKEGSFHWKMTVSHKYLLQGYIFKNDDEKLIHKIFYKNLSI